MRRLAASAAIGVSALLVAGSGSAVTSSTLITTLAITTANSIPGPGLWRLDLADRRLTRLTKQRGDSYPAWSRDGQQLAFTRRGHLFLVGRDGNGEHAVGNLAAFNPSWGPGDRQLVIGANGLWVVNPDGSGRRRISSFGQEPAWSPNGQTILFALPGRGIYAVRPNGKGLHRVIKTPTSAGHLYSLQAPAWAPTGKRIAYFQQDLMAITTAGPLLRTANPDGTGQRTAARLSITALDFGVPAWSPDSTAIAVAEFRGKPEGIFTIPSGGGKPTLLYGGSSGTVWGTPSWTAAGS